MTWIVDYDLSLVHNNARRQFYRKVHRFLKTVSPVTWSTQSVIICESEEVAEQIYGMARELGSAHLYKAQRLK